MKPRKMHLDLSFKLFIIEYPELFQIEENFMLFVMALTFQPNFLNLKILIFRTVSKVPKKKLNIHFYLKSTYFTFYFIFTYLTSVKTYSKFIL
jgi:hypothetical protein